ncbi:hypothetical protein [Tenacibaculum soleae]|uniref:hypothetical protein n=1 Tax=Tenacibaculum soleae TaxID=447689 RepID=UPI00230174C4|nr:hypothetical protein [Tenacibaculum soleae]
MKKEESTSQLYFSFLDCERLRSQLTINVKKSVAKRKESQKVVSETLQIALTKIKEIEKGTCKDFNAINNYLNYFSEPIFETLQYQ